MKKKYKVQSSADVIWAVYESGVDEKVFDTFRNMIDLDETEFICDFSVEKIRVLTKSECFEVEVSKVNKLGAEKIHDSIETNAVVYEDFLNKTKLGEKYTILPNDQDEAELQKYEKEAFPGVTDEQPLTEEEEKKQQDHKMRVRLAIRKKVLALKNITNQERDQILLLYLKYKDVFALDQDMCKMSKLTPISSFNKSKTKTNGV